LKHGGTEEAEVWEGLLSAAINQVSTLLVRIADNLFSSAAKTESVRTIPWHY